MSRKPRASIMTAAEMDVMNETKHAGHLYPDKEKSDAVQTIVRGLRDGLASPLQISLNDTQTVKATTLEYLSSCERTGTIPSKIGLCRALGVSRQGVDDFCRRHAGHPTSEYLTLAFDGFSEVLTNAALIGAAQPVVSIFIAKSIYGYRDALTIETPSRDPLGQPADQKTLYDRYLDTTERDDSFEKRT